MRFLRGKVQLTSLPVCSTAHQCSAVDTEAALRVINIQTQGQQDETLQQVAKGPDWSDGVMTAASRKWPTKASSHEKNTTGTNDDDSEKGGGTQTRRQRSSTARWRFPSWRADRPRERGGGAGVCLVLCIRRAAVSCVFIN